MSDTNGINHLGLAVADLAQCQSFFTQALGWQASGYDPHYPRVAVSDGVVRLTLWQVDQALEATAFNRRKNIGLHHLALEVVSKAKLDEIYQKVSLHPGVAIEFAPELVGDGPRMHMMCAEPGGIRVEFIWLGEG